MVTPPEGIERGKKGLARLPADNIRRLERKIEERFRGWAVDLVTNERWLRYYNALNTPGQLTNSPKRRLRELLLVVWEFGGDYAKLLERAVLEYANEIGKLLVQKSQIALGEREWKELWDTSLGFVKRFTKDKYERPWGGFFMLPPAESGELPDQRMFRVDFQRVNPLARLFREVEEAAATEKMAETHRSSENPQGDYFDYVDAGRKKVLEEFSKGIDSAGWTGRAASRAENELHILMLQAIGDRRVRADLTLREKKIWEVAQRGSKGATYCRELARAGVKPRRTKSWESCPGTYPAAYMDPYWRQRIQDEKSKVKKKANQLGLAR